MTWQVLAYLGVVIATLCVAYGFWMVSSLYKDFPDVPTDQLNYAFLTNVNKYKGRIAIFFCNCRCRRCHLPGRICLATQLIEATESLLISQAYGREFFALKSDLQIGDPAAKCISSRSQALCMFYCIHLRPQFAIPTDAPAPAVRRPLPQ